MDARYFVLAGVLALSDPAGAAEPIDTIEVLGSTPLGGKLAADKFASNVQSATSEQLRAQGALDLAEFMNRNLGSVFLNEAQSNPLQPDVQYRGYVGSPLLGLPQGIAVYQDGVRLNEPFGDTVNWALIPDSAIRTLYLMPGSNPLFGLNALGGAISVETKDGFSHPGSAAELYGGSFSRIGVQAETGGSLDDRLSYYLTGSYLEEAGWRDFSPTEAIRFFGKLGWSSERTSIDFSFNYADTDLIGNGAAPVELLQIDREAIFTRPDQTENELTLLNVSVSHRLSNALTLMGNAYARSSDIKTLNGDDSDFEECENTPGFICEEQGGDEELVVDRDANPIPASAALEGASVNRTSTEQDSSGFALQASWSAGLAARENQLLVGFAYDTSDIAFDASTELGALDATRLAVPGGIFVGDSFTRLNANNSNAGFYFSNTLSLTDSVALTISGRYNRTDIELRDQLGTALDGDHEFDRFNPAIGLTAGLSDSLAVYAGYSESNRAPSPVELTCADEDDPCRLPNAFLADPPLEQVVAETIELGLRGTWREGKWHAGVFRTTNHDDILFISAGALTNEGFFDNIGQTRRDGVELNLSGEFGERLGWFANYTYLDATFSNDFAVPSPNNPVAIDGEILVESGDRLPLIPDQSLKAGLQYAVTPRLTLGGNVLARSGTYLRGDEGNELDKVGSYVVMNLHAEYSLGETIQLYVKLDNVFDREYETFGLFGQAAEVLGDAFENNRFLSPAAPRAAWVGIRARR